jgi:hypothetical protein
MLLHVFHRRILNYTNLTQATSALSSVALSLNCMISAPALCRNLIFDFTQGLRISLSVSPFYPFVIDYRAGIQRKKAEYSMFLLVFCSYLLQSCSGAIVQGYEICHNEHVPLSSALA